MTKTLIALSFSLIFAAHSNAQTNAQTLEPTVPVASPTPQELALSPLLDLYSGGQATGAAQGTGVTAGGLVNGTELPKKGEGFVNDASTKDDWGTGLMISFIENAAPLMAQQFPGNLMYIGAIAQPLGGSYAPHSSHQNGLDADILFVGQKNYKSVIDKDGAVMPTFETEKNWAFWRLAVNQQFAIMKGKTATTTSAVSMILVDPRIKTYLCSWAKAREATLDSLDMEVLRRLRPTVGHDDHFHLRFKCSPHYASCINGGEGRAETGCADLPQ